MAFVNGDIDFYGRVGNYIYYKRKGKRVVREVRNNYKEKLNTRNSMATIRKNNNEFGYASQFGKTLKHSFSEWIVYAQDSNLSGRLLKFMKKIMTQDTIRPFGKRSVVNGDFTILKGFNFNSDCPLNNTFYYNPFITVDRKKGFVTASLPSFNCNEALRIPKNATHFKIILCCSEVDFINQKSKSDHLLTDATTIDNLSPSESFIFSITKRGRKPVFVAMGIQYFQMINGVLNPILNRKFNPFAIVEVNY